MHETELFQRVKSSLQAAFGGRLRGVVCYGSRVRGDNADDSDLDLLVLLDDPVRLGDDLETIVAAIYPLQLEWEAPIHATPVSFKDFDAGVFGLYRTAKREGVLV